jgi:excisionase family DNA binding protein
MTYHSNDTLRAAPQRATLSIPEAARLLGISRNACYEAARRGELPVLRIGARILVLLAPLTAMLNGEQPAPTEV